MDTLMRMKEALDLMERKMEERLDIEAIAKTAYVSPFHFQRMFHIITGMTVAEYVRKRKLTLAAQELASTTVKVVDVSIKYGYDSPESFSKAFRKIHGISPSEARQPGVNLKAFPRISFHLSLKGDKDMDYRIEDKPAFQVVGKVYALSCKDNEQTREIPLKWQTCHQDGTIAELSSIGTGANLFGICLDMEPNKEEITYMIAGMADPATLKEGYSKRTIPAASWAIFSAEGPVSRTIPILFGRIFQEWFPATGYSHAEGPEMEVYPPGDTNAEDYRCEVWIPIVKP